MKSFIKLLFLFISYSIQSQSYIPDSSFGTNGEAIFNGVPFSPKNAILENNNYYFISNNQLCKVNYSGSIDYSFGDGGFTTLYGAGQTFNIRGFKLINNSFYLFGQTTNSGKDLFIAKVGLSGQFDTAFGNGGYLIANFGLDEELNDFTLDSSGNLFCIGDQENPTTGLNKLIYFKLSPSGNLDTLFDANGYKVLMVNSQTHGQTILPYNGNYILVGLSRLSGNTFNYHLLVSQVDTNGNLVNSFGTNGSILKELYPGMSIDLKEVHILNNTILANYFYGWSHTYGNRLIGFDFTNNTEVFHFNIAMGSSIKLYNNGFYTIEAEYSCSGCSSFSYLKKRSPNGTIDTSFSNNGTYTFTSPPTYFISNISLISMAIDQSNGKILAAGRINRAQPGTNGIQQNGFAIFRIAEGTLSSNDFEKENLTIYPNPFSDHVTINSEKEIKEIEIYNALGEKINQGFNFNKETSVLDLSKINPAGVYLIRMISKDNNVSYKKIIKQ